MASPIKKINLNKSGRNTYPSSEKRFFVEVQLTYYLHGKSYYTIVWDWFIFPAYAFKIKQKSNIFTSNISSLNLCGKTKIPSDFQLA